MENATNGTKPARMPARKSNADARKVAVAMQRPASRAEKFLMLAIEMQEARYALAMARGRYKMIEREMREILRAENDRLDNARTVR